MPTTINQVIAVINSRGAAFIGIAWPMLVQSMVVMAALLVLVWACRRVRAVLRYALLMLVLVKLLLPPSLSLPTGLAYWWPVAEPVIPDQPHAPALSTEPQPSQSSSAGVNVSGPGMVFLVWMAGLAALAAYILARYRRLSRLEKLAAPIELEELADSCRRELGLRRSLPLRISAVCASPAVCGLFRPVIVIPRVLVDQLSFSQLRQVLLHELIHVKRRDLWVNHLQVLLQVFYWYNPLLWLANAVIRRIREEAVDEAVTVTLGQGAESYPETLVAVAKLAVLRPSPGLGFIGIVEPKTALKQRLTRLTQNPVPRTGKVGWVNSTLILVLGGLLLPMAHPESPPKDAAQITSGEIPDFRNVSGSTDSRFTGVVTESDIDKAIAKEMAKAGDRASLLKLLQAQGLTFEQFRQKLRRQLIMAAVAAKASNILAKIEIRHVGPTFVADEQIRAKISAKVGAPENRNDVDLDVRNLYATGLFYNIRVEEERNPEGTVLVYVLQEKPRLSQITFEGNTKVGDQALRDKLTSRVSEPLDERKLFQDAQNLQESYRRLGYARAGPPPFQSIPRGWPFG
jgi:beta-lactamase regulating signal transducer with metallopeptidase domain